MRTYRSTPSFPHLLWYAARPPANVFVRRDGAIHHFYSTELLCAPFEPGMDGRHVDLIWPLWNLFDLTPEDVVRSGIQGLAIDRYEAVA